MGPSSAPGEEEVVTDASLRAATLRLLDAADPVSDTERRIRSRLEAEFGRALTREIRAAGAPKRASDGCLAPVAVPVHAPIPSADNVLHAAAAEQALLP